MGAMMTSRREARCALLAALVASGCGADYAADAPASHDAPFSLNFPLLTLRSSPRALQVARPAPVVVTGWKAGVKSGPSGKGRARVIFGYDVLSPDFEAQADSFGGVRAQLTGGGATLIRPVGKASPDRRSILLEDLTPGTTYDVKLFVVNEIGLESAATSTWNHDGDEDTPEIKLRVAVPAAHTPLVPSAGSAADVVRAPGLGNLVYTIMFGYESHYGVYVDRAPEGTSPPASNTYVRLTPQPITTWHYPVFVDSTVAAGTEYWYRIVYEDLDGNVSDPSPPTEQRIWP